MCTTCRSRDRAASRLLAGAAAGLLALTGCDTGARTTAPVTASRAAAVTGAVTVFAAASLTGTFQQLGEDFEAANPDATVSLNFGASSSLAQQIVAGAPADVFASASPATMAVVVDAGEATAPTVFARNRLQIAVPADNPGGVTGLPDFADEHLTIALCAVEVPCGAAAQEVFAISGITAAPDTLEQDVKAALGKVTLGEVDAALVYRTDVLAAGDRVRGIAFQEAGSAVNDYPVAALSGAPNGTAAAAFVAHVLSPEGQRVLTDAGFDRP